MLTGTNLTHAKRHNLQIVHETIRLFAPISREGALVLNNLLLTTAAAVVLLGSANCFYVLFHAVPSGTNQLFTERRSTPHC